MTSTVPLNFTLLPLFSAKIPPTVGRQVSVTVPPLELDEEELLEEELLLEDEFEELELLLELDELELLLELDELELLLEEELEELLLLDEEELLALEELLELEELEELALEVLEAGVLESEESEEPEGSGVWVNAWSEMALKLKPWFLPQPEAMSAHAQSA